MVMASVGLFSGMEPTEDSIDELRRADNVDRVELEPGVVQAVTTAINGGHRRAVSNK